MPYSCLISKLPIKENVEFYVLPLTFRELSISPKEHKYSAILERTINMKNELYSVALLPTRAYIRNSEINLIEDSSSDYFLEKTKINMQDVLRSMIVQDHSYAGIYFEKAGIGDKFVEHLYPCFILKNVWDECLEKLSTSKYLWDSLEGCGYSVFEKLNFENERLIRYKHKRINNLSILEDRGDWLAKLNDNKCNFYTISGLEEFLNKHNHTLGKEYVEFAKTNKVTRYAIENCFGSYGTYGNYFEDISNSFMNFYNKDLLRFMNEFVDLIEMLDILFSANIMLDKPKYVVGAKEEKEYIKNFHSVLGKIIAKD